MTVKYDGFFEKLQVFEQVEKRLIVDVIMTSKINLAELEQ